MEISMLGVVQLARLVLENIGSHKKHKQSQRQKVQQDVIIIKRELEMMQSFLMDVGSKRGQSEVLKTYVRLARDLAYDGEDCLLEFLLCLEQPLRANPKLLLTEDAIAMMLKELRSRVEGVNMCKKQYCEDGSGLAVQSGSTIGTLPLPRINSVAHRNAPLIGRQMERSHLIRLISQEGEHGRVISIWGMVGIGKTALTKSVYESKEIACMFEQRVWVSVMRPFNLDDVLTNLSRQLNAKNISVPGQTISQVVWSSIMKSEESRNPLNSMRCIIVLDGVMSIEEWKLIKPHLPATKARSIIVTTREGSVAEHCSTTYKNIYKLQALQDADALELFKQKVFMEISYSDFYPDITTEAKQILKECDGHPLTISSISEILVSKPVSAIEWRKFNDHFSVGFESIPSLKLIRAALSATYDDLPYHVKLCLLYVSIFPKGQEIRRRRLVTRWIAEGYSYKTHSKSAEEIGESYFQEFINRSIIRPSKTVPSSVGSIDYFHVHNLHHKISVSKSMEENHGFLLGSRYNNQDTTRHIVVINNESDRNKINNMDLSHVRSLTVFGEWRSFYISIKMRLLRVLDLEGTYGLKNDDLKHIGNFLHLRYLSLRGCVDIYHLPDSVGDLWDLLMLDVSGTNIIKLPITITNLKMLQYIRAGNLPQNEDVIPKESSSDNSKRVEESISDAKLPEAIARTVQFSMDVWDYTVDYFNSLIPNPTYGLDRLGVEVPDGIGKLNALRTLGVVNVSVGRVITELEKLTQLHKLGVTGINRENSTNVLSTIGNLTLLISLSMRSEGNPGLHGCLDHPFSPPPNLQSLKLYGNLVTLPTWINQLQNIAKLKLRSTRLEYGLAMKVLEKLPRLAILRLWMNSFQDEELVFHFQRESFPSLMVLELAGQNALKSIRFDEGAMTKLELLQIEDCIRVGKDMVYGMSFLPNLKEVVLNGDYDDNFLKKLSTEVALNRNQPILKVVKLKSMGLAIGTLYATHAPDMSID